MDSHLPALRQWQVAAADFLHTVLVSEGRDHAYVCAPAVSGKSRLMHEAGDGLDIPGARVIIVGKKAIVDQHRKGFRKFGYTAVQDGEESAEFLSPAGHRMVITTWQGLAMSPDRFRHILPVGILFFDECHIGGSNSANVSYRTILEEFAPRKRVNVSATTETASEMLLGPKRGHHYRYKLSTAYEDGILHPVSLVEVHAGTRAKIVPLENQLGRNFEQLEELEGKELGELASKLGDASVEVATAVTRIIEHRHDSMIELYFNRHTGEQAIFFSPNIETARHASLRFNSYGRRLGAPVRSYAVHSQEPHHAGLIEDFRKGSIKVLFVVGMLQEGFDMPSLRLAFDCRFHRKWDKARIARLTQKIDRVMRLHPGKQASLYYYARDITDFYRNRKARPRGVPEPILDIVPDVTDETGGEPEEYVGREDLVEDVDENLAEAASMVAASVAANADGAADMTPWEATIEINPTEVERIDVERVDEPEIERDEIRTKRVTLATTPLYVLHDVRDHVIVRQRNFAELFGNDVAASKVTLLEMAARGEEKPTGANNELAWRLGHYTNSRVRSFDAEFNRKVRKLAPDWFSNTVANNKAALLEMARNGEDRPLSRKHPLGVLLTYYTSSSQSTYDAAFREEILRLAPHWFKGFSIRAKLLELAKKGGKRPNRKTPLATALTRFTSSNNESYDKELSDKIRALAPHWFEDTVASNKAALLDMAERGERRPASGKHPLGKSLITYTIQTSPTYDPDFLEKICALAPAWFADTAADKKAKLLEIARRGEGRPTQGKHPLGYMLYAYLTPGNECHDPAFLEEIRRIAPHWLDSSVRKKKAAVLELARQGGKRPSYRKDKLLSTTITNYTNPSRNSYDPEFTEQLRKIAPHWFSS